MWLSASGSKKLIIICLLLLLASGFSAADQLPASESQSSSGELEVLAEFTDPTGDDHGPGYYAYPNHDVFAPQQELLDLLSFSLKRHSGKDFYRFKFEFARLTDPWDSRYGFSHPLIHLYFDTEEGGSAELFREGANVSLNPDYSWNRHLRISGWWVRLMSPDDDPWDMVRDLNIDAETSPWDVAEASISTEGGFIRLDLPREKMGRLDGSRLYLLVGAFDPFGEDYFRGIRQYPSNWSFYAAQEVNLDYAPRVIDYLQEEEGAQEEILADFAEDYPEISPVKIPEREDPLRENFFLLVALGYLTAAAIIISALEWLIYRS